MQALDRRSPARRFLPPLPSLSQSWLALAGAATASGLIVAALLAQTSREAVAYTVTSLIVAGATLVVRRHAHVSRPQAPRRELRAIAHDLRAPLLTISSYLDLISEGAFGAVTPETRAALRQAASAAGRAQALVDATLQCQATLPRESTAGAARPLARVDLEDVLSEVLDALTVPLRARHAAVAMEGRLPVVQGDATALFRVFENLLQNSIKYAREGVSPRISLQSRALEGGLVEIAIRDNGRGIHPDEHQAVVMDGVRGSSAGSIVFGHGIGLATVTGLVASMGGTVTIDTPDMPDTSMELPGTTIRVALRHA